MRIYTPEIIYGHESVALRSIVEYSGRKEQLWYSVLPEWAEYLTTERCDAFLVGLLLVAMSTGEDIYIEGTISEKLYYNLTNYYMRIMKALIPSLKLIKIISKKIDCTKIREVESGVTAGFSGGVDSFCLITDHFYNLVPEGFKLTHLLFFNVGSHGKGGRSLFEKRYKKLLPLTMEMGIPFIKVDSNIDELIPFGFQLTHTIRNVSAALAFQKLAKRHLFASSFTYQDSFVGPTYSMGYSEPFAIHLLSTETTECISSGCQYSRVEKIARIVDIPKTRDYLDVCVDPYAPGNCSVCWKCARTMLTLEILGKLDLYNNVFDLDKYYKIRNNYIGEMLYSKDPLEMEIKLLAKEKGKRFPFLSSNYYYAKSVISDALRKGIKKLKSI